MPVNFLGEKSLACSLHSEDVPRTEGGWCTLKNTVAESTAFGIGYCLNWGSKFGGTVPWNVFKVGIARGLQHSPDRWSRSSSGPCAA